VLLLGLSEAAAARAMTAAMKSSCDISGAAHLPAATASRIALGNAACWQGSATAFRLEGFAPSVAHRKAALESLLQPFAEIADLDEPLSRDLWRMIRDVTPFAAAHTGADRPLWRISTAPTQGAEVARLVAEPIAADVMFDWAGGLLWVLLPALEDAGAAPVRTTLAGVGGHATLIRAPAAIRAVVDVFEPQDAALAALTRRVKEGFDPQRILNPGRMWAGQ